MRTLIYSMGPRSGQGKGIEVAVYPYLLKDEGVVVHNEIPLESLPAKLVYTGDQDSIRHVQAKLIEAAKAHDRKPTPAGEIPSKFTEVQRQYVDSPPKISPRVVSASDIEGY